MKTRRTLRPLLTVFALATMTAASYPTSAADPKSAAPPAATTSPAQQADEQFLKGKALLKDGKKQDALAAYRAAFELRKSYDVAGNLGSLELELGLFRDAAEHLAYALAHYAPTGTTQEQLAKAKQRFDQARKEVCGVRITATVDGAEVYVDGVSIGRAPIAEEVFLSPGARKIEAKYPGYVTVMKSVDAKKGAAEEVTLTLEKEVAVPTATATASVSGVPTVEAPPRSLVPAYVMGGVGVASLIAGGVLIGLAETEHGQLRAEAPRGPSGELLCWKAPAPGSTTKSECDAWRAKSASASTEANVGVSLLVAGGVVVAGAAAYWLWGSRAPARGSAGGRSWQVVPMIGANGGGMLWTGDF